jgi:nucleoside phosphorylase
MAASSASQRRRAVVVTALEVEYRAVRVHLRNLREEQHPHSTIYEVGEFGQGVATWEIALVEIGAGNAGAAVEAERAIQHFAPEVVLFVGVAGGLKDVAPGDVVVATKVYNYAAGKAKQEFEPRPDLGLGAYELLERAKAERRKDDWLRRIGSVPTPPPKVHVAPIAAGEQVIASRKSATFRLLRKLYGDAVAVEMEGRGFLQAAHANAQVKAMVIRGISDVIQGKTRADASGWQERASCHAAAFAIELLAKLPGATTAAPAQGGPGSRAIPLPAGAGSYTGPASRVEHLVSNLLRVESFAPTLYLAETRLRKKEQLWGAFQEVDEVCPSEVVLKDRRLLSFRDLREFPWTRVCDRGTVEEFGAEEWAYSPDPDRRREFVQLLNGALREKLRPAIRYWSQQGVYAFAPSRDLTPLTRRYQHGMRYVRRTVFDVYTTTSKSTGKTYTHYRHLAFRGHFRLLDGRWYLEITPTFIFTRDGRTIHRFHEDWLKGIKRLDRNRAVLAQLLVWQAQLREEGDMFSPPYPYLTFDQLEEVRLDVGILDEAWQAQDELALPDHTDETGLLEVLSA